MIHDTHFAQFIPPNLWHFVTGTWADAAGTVAHTIAKKKAQANDTSTVTIPVIVPSNSVALKGAKPASIEVDYEVATLALDALTATLYKVTRGANGAPAVATAVPFTYDAGHDTPAERITIAKHRMALAITTPFWLDNDEELLVELSVDAGATSDFYAMGAVANYIFRA